jgi:hypothetical protein
MINPRNHVQQRRFTASRRAVNGKKSASRHAEGNIIEEDSFLGMGRNGSAKMLYSNQASASRVSNGLAGFFRSLHRASSFHDEQTQPGGRKSLIYDSRPHPAPFTVSIPGKLPEVIDPWLDSALSLGWIVRSCVWRVTTVIGKVGDCFFMKRARREFCPVSSGEPLKSCLPETWEVIEGAATARSREAVTSSGRSARTAPALMPACAGLFH